MMLRMARLGVLLAAATGLLIGHMPAAQATTVATVKFVVIAAVTAPGNSAIAYPCAPRLPGELPTPGDITGPLCLGLILTPFSPHNPSGVAFTNVACVAAGITVNKPGKLPAEAGNCVLGGGGTVAGHCGLSTGAVAGGLTSGGMGNVQDYTYNLTFSAVGGVLVLQGGVTKTGNGSGTLVGVALAVPNPLDGSSCTNLHNLTFIVAGGAAVVIVT